MEKGKYRLVVVLPQLGDFDSLEYAQALVADMPRLRASGIAILAIGIGNADSAERFCTFTGFPKQSMLVDDEPTLHRALGLYGGLKTPGGPWPALFLMCAGIGSPGTLLEVLRGYTGDRGAPQRIANNETINISPFPSVTGSFFSRAGGEGFQRPFELATIRLRNMIEVLSNLRIYLPRDEFITQRGGTYLLDGDDRLLYSYQDKGILGFSETMAKPLSFLGQYLDKN